MENRYVFFLGSHPALSAAEVWYVLKKESYRPRLGVVNDRLLTATVAQSLDLGLLTRLGGVDRIAEVVAQQAEPYTAEQVLSLLELASGKKVTLGISSIDMPVSYSKRLGSALKKLVREHDGRLRFVLSTGRGGRLNAAQVSFNGLLEAPNMELTIVAQNNEFWLYRTVQVQDIEAYERRDTKRPARDAQVGMLPPKLAQLMLNLGLGQLAGTPPYRILDPFCGMGTILQEGWLLGHTMLGMDSNPRMITASEHNLAHLAEHFPVKMAQQPTLVRHDVTVPYPEQYHNAVDAVVTEPYLGKPLKTPLLPDEMAKQMDMLGELYLAFFTNMLEVLIEQGLVLLALPAWRRKRGGKALDLLPEGWLDAVEELGYSRLQLVPEELAAAFAVDDRSNTVYARPDALVGRELTLWRKV